MPKILNLTNFTFGKLTVLYRTKSSPHGYYWMCQCECGNKKEILGSNLKNGNTKSCGKCNKIIKNQFVPKDITNFQFGEWTALYRTTKQNSTGSYYWHCKCSCGNERDVEIGSLLSGKSKSCGHVKSFGEKKIAEILKASNQNFIQEYTFDDCLTEKGYKCKFDFAIFQNNKLFCLIEYDGKQHFENSIFDLDRNQQRDTIKNNYCLKNNIKLFRIPYTDLNKINSFSDIIQQQYLVIQ